MNTEDDDMAVADSVLGAEALPNELVMTEILARLPAKSVGRCRCVSRGWSAMLSSDFFIDLHRQRANRPDQPRLLLTAYGSSYDDYLYSWQPGGDGAVEKLMRDDFGLQNVVTKPCHGLVLTVPNGCGGYCVLNPSSGQILPLPDTQVPFKMAYKIPGRPVEPPCYLSVSYGLGYCATRKEYKVVRLFSNVLSGPAGFTPTATACEVFVLGTTATGYWRPSAERSPFCSVMQWNPAVFLDGNLHFLCFDGGIVTFSITDETFGSLPPPPAAFGNSVLTELDGHLCVCHGEPNSDDPLALCVYYNEEAQWENLCCIDRTAWPESERMLLKSLWVAPICVYYSASSSMKKIMFGTGSCKVFAVDSNGGGDPEILLTPEDTIIGSCEDGYIPVIGIYEESLVPLGCKVEDMIFASPKAKSWFNILKWLPALSLSELRMVCREWRGMITSDCFIRSHVVHANMKMKRSPHIMFIIDPSFGRYVHLEECIRDPRLLRSQPKFVVCSQPCHGLNVGNWSHENYFICNPIMRYFERIRFDDSDETFFAGRIGLGYDTEIDKHVLVQINYKEKNLDTRSYELKCSKKRVNGEWYPIDPPPRPVAPIQPTFVNGKIYWIVEANLGPVSSARCEIVAFDVKTEEFEVLRGPPCAHHGVGLLTILELYGTLCVSYSGQSRNTIDLWMMKDPGIWLMEYHIVLDELAAKAAPLAVDPTDGRILLNTGLSLGYYDPKTAAFETLIITEGIPGHPDYGLYPIVCHESLVCPLQFYHQY